ncbi:MAG: glutathione S-transferase family protein [Burkholderiales bacterium]
MSLTLYYASGACSFVPHVLLESLGVPFEPVPVKLHKGEHLGDAYKVINPRSQVPVLVDGGHTITQIVAIVSYLDACHPQALVLPSAPLARARALEILSWMNNSAHITFAHIFMPHKFTDEAAAHAAMKTYNQQQYRAVLQELQALVTAAAANGTGWLDAGQPGALDAYALTLLRWGTMVGINPQDYPALWAFVQRLAQQPVVARVIERERLKLNWYEG